MTEGQEKEPNSKNDYSKIEPVEKQKFADSMKKFQLPSIETSRSNNQIFLPNVTEPILIDSEVVGPKKEVLFNDDDSTNFEVKKKNEERKSNEEKTIVENFLPPNSAHLVFFMINTKLKLPENLRLGR